MKFLPTFSASFSKKVFFSSLIPYFFRKKYVSCVMIRLIPYISPRNLSLAFLILLLWNKECKQIKAACEVNKFNDYFLNFDLKLDLKNMKRNLFFYRKRRELLFLPLHLPLYLLGCQILFRRFVWRRK
jgi:hypothetical protein